MATYNTKQGNTFDDRSGVYWFWGQNDPSNPNSKNYSNWYIPKHDMATLSGKKLAGALDYYQEYIKNGGDPKASTLKMELENIMGSSNIDNKIAYIEFIIDKNADKTGFYSDGSKAVFDENDQLVDAMSANQYSTPSYDSGLDYYKQLIEDSATTNRNSEFAKQYQADMYSNINAYEQATNATLASAELDAYKMLGQQQLQLENQIASQRMQALKSGVTSAQLASQELANMFAAQSSAQQVAQNVLAQRADSAATFNQQRAGVMTGLYDILANNQTTQANAYAQLGAAQASYNSYMQQPYAQYQAMLQAAQNPYYTKGMNPDKQ